MKFPLSQSPFGEYPALSEAQSERVQQLVQQTLAETLAEYNVHHQKQRRLLPRAQYKVVKKAENLVCYRQRHGFKAEEPTSTLLFRTNASSPSASASHAYSACNDNGESSWIAPKLVTVGTLVGTLEDVMYGLLAPDATSTFIRASYTNEELLDSELLHCIKAPTTETPFQFCSVKWHVLGLTKITSNRDFVFVEASGTVDSSNNERVGYHIMHSVDLPGLGELSEQYQVRRGRMVSCHLFRQLPNGSVDVYMKGSVDPGGHMPESVAIASTASALLKLGQAVECSHSKKLEYLLEQQQIKRSSAMRRTSGSSHVSSRSSAQSDRSIGPIKLIQSNKSSKSCAICSATLHLFRSVASCELCTHAVCSRCRVTRRLSYRVAHPKELKEKNTIVCTSCIAAATCYSAVEVACAELTVQANFNENAVKDSFHSGKARNFLSSSTVSSNNVALSSNCTRLETPVEEDEEESASSRRRSLSFDVSDVRVRRRSTTHPPTAAESKLAELDLSVSLSVVSCSSDYLDEDFYEGEAGQRKTQPPNVFSEIPELPETTNPLTSSLPPKPSVPPMNSQLRQRRELMRRMTELRKNAESAFQITQRNTEMMQCGGMPLKAQSVCISTVEVGMDLD